MLATPANLADLGVGFTLSEGMVASLEEIRSVNVLSAAGEISGHEVQIAVIAQRFAAILDRRRNLTGRTGCGVCGAETIEDAIRVPPPVRAGGAITREALSAAVRALRSSQPLNATVGSLHAAAWCSWQGELQITREDVGRHNALDKVIGSLAQSRADFTAGFAMVTSRASYELVQKAATMGVRMLVAVSAPTALAIRLAQSTGLTLVGFAREQQLVVYAHPERIE
jgi:FdhD protein